MLDIIALTGQKDIAAEFFVACKGFPTSLIVTGQNNPNLKAATSHFKTKTKCKSELVWDLGDLGKMCNNVYLQCWRNFTNKCRYSFYRGYREEFQQLFYERQGLFPVKADLIKNIPFKTESQLKEY